MREAWRLLWRTFWVGGTFAWLQLVHAQTAEEWQRMHSAYAQRDLSALNNLRARVPKDHVLQPLLQYWALSARLPDATATEIEAFLTQWAGTYHEDRLRNEWMRLLGERGEWALLLAQDDLFRMQDDEDVACWVGVAQWHVQQRWDLAKVSAAWDAQRRKGPGCMAAAAALMAQGHWPQQRVIDAVRKAVEYGRRSEAKALAGLLDAQLSSLADEAIRRPERVLQRLEQSLDARWRSEVATWAWLRQVKQAPSQWTQWQAELRHAGLSRPQQTWVASTLATWMALAQMPEAVEVFPADLAPVDETHAEWRLRAALRLSDWKRLQRWLSQSPAALRDEPTWRFWQAVVWQQSGDAQQQAQARRWAQALVEQGGYYGALAQARWPLMAKDEAVPEVSAQDIRKVQQNPGLQRAQTAMSLGLYGPGVREWHYTVALHRGQDWPVADLRAAAQWACELGLWDRCINTSLRIDGPDDASRRYPTPWREAVSAAAQEAGVDVSSVYGLMRQESRFVSVARSTVGASGLMQLMPGTARWTAKRMGMSREDLARWREPEVNLKLGMHYWAHVLTQSGGALPVAAVAYNSGPGRAKRWLPEQDMDTAIWIETLPITETRLYAQHVSHNAWTYRRVMGLTERAFVDVLTPSVNARQWVQDGDDDS